MDDYSEQEKHLLRNANRIFFPTIRFVDVFDAMGIPTFPNATTYHHRRSRIFQNILFQYMDWPHPRTRIYYGHQRQHILEDFQFPLLISGPNARGHLLHEVNTPEALQEELESCNPVVIREAVKWTERVRAVYVEYECIAAWHLDCCRAEHGTFQPISDEAKSPAKGVFELSHRMVRMARLNDILLEWGKHEGSWKLIQMECPPSHLYTPAGIIDRHAYICKLIQSGML